MRGFKSYILAILSLLALSACGLDALDQKGSVIGRVYNEDRSIGISNAQVAISAIDQNALTDVDGWYSFSEIPFGQYTITVTKESYAQHTGQISIQSEKSTLYDVVLYSALAIMDASGKAITMLDFGESFSSLTLMVYNISNEAIRCSAQTDISWASVSLIQNLVPEGGSQEIKVYIGRSKLNGGSNIGNLSVVAGSLKKNISLIAIGETRKPKVQTLPMSSYYGTGGGWVDTFNGRVIDEGKPPYKQKGFCFSSSNREPTVSVSDIIVGVSGNDGAKEFSFYASEYFANHPYRETYYARAWIMYGENQYEYGDVIEFVFNPSNLTF